MIFCLNKLWRQPKLPLQIKQMLFENHLLRAYVRKLFLEKNYDGENLNIQRNYSRSTNNEHFNEDRVPTYITIRLLDAKT